MGRSAQKKHVFDPHPIDKGVGIKYKKKWFCKELHAMYRSEKKNHFVNTHPQ